METQVITFEGEALEIIQSIEKDRENLFVTGKAGTGKSTLLKYILKKYGENMVVVAPTGVAAIQANGDTIHSFFRLKPGYELDEARHLKLNSLKSEKYQAIDTLLIDEISMVRADILDAVSILLQRTRNNLEPFGGVRVIFFGDLYQLPPVVTATDQQRYSREYASPYFFSAKLFQAPDLFTPGLVLRTIELKKIYRQQDTNFIDVLNAVRINRTNTSQLKLLNNQYQPNFVLNQQEKRICIVGTLRQAYDINRMELSKIRTSEHTFHAVSFGNVDGLIPHDKCVTVKVGAQVIFVKNDPQKRWVNGTIGRVLSIRNLEDEAGTYQVCRIETDRGEAYDVSPFTWSIAQYRFRSGRFLREEIGTFTQMPFKLAWAITVHKSQGKTFNKVCIDLRGGVFAHGQLYVALSRCPKLEDIILQASIDEKDILMDQTVVDFMKGVNR